MTDRLLAQLHLPNAGGAAIAGAGTASAAILAGLARPAADRLGEVTAAACALIEQTAYDRPDVAHLTVHVRVHAHDLVVEIDDEGLPFNTVGVDRVLEQVVGPALRDGVVDEYDHVTRGREGNRSVLMAHLGAGPDLRERIGDPRDDPTVSGECDRVDPSAIEALIVRPAEGDDAEGLAQLTWRTYGYSYQRDEYYHPDQLRDLLTADDHRGWVLATPDGELVGHLAVKLAHPGAMVAEGGRGMVDPRYRGAGLMRTLGMAMYGWLTERSVIGLHGHAVTAHTLTQGHEDVTITGILLGFLPPVVSFKGVATEVTGRRQAVAMTYSMLADQPERTVHVATLDHDLVAAVYERLGLARTINAIDVRPGDVVDSTGGTRGPGSASAQGGRATAASGIDLQVHHDLGTARFVVHTPTDETFDVIRAQLPTVLDAEVDVTYLSLPLSSPATPATAEQAKRLGFYFGGVVPYLASDGGDALLLQRTGDLPIERSDIQLASSFSERVLDHVLHQRAVVRGAQ